MQTEDFIARVSAEVPSIDSNTARAATLATLESLCAHLPENETESLAAQLPKELSEAANAGKLRANENHDGVQLREFYEQIAMRVNISHQDATGYAKATAMTLKEAISGGELSDVALELPNELSELLAAT